MKTRNDASRHLLGNECLSFKNIYNIDGVWCDVCMFAIKLQGILNGRPVPLKRYYTE